MKYLGRFLAVLAALLFVATLPCATWAFSTGQMLLNAESYKNALSRQNAYSDLIPALLPAIAEAEEQHNVNADTLTFLNVVGNLDAEDWQRIAAELIPADWLQVQVETNIDAFFNWLNDREALPNIRFDTASLRERLSGLPGQRAVNLIMESWPPCTQEQLDVLLNFSNTPEAAFPFCQPPGEYFALTSEALSNTLREQAQQLPDVYPPPDWLNNNRTRLQLNQFKLGVRWMQTFVAELWVLAAALLSLVVFFTVRSLKSLGRWSGVSLIASGIAAVIPIPLLISPFLLPPALTSAFSNGESGSPGAGVGRALGDANTYLNTIIHDITRSIIGEITAPVLTLAALTIGLGFVALVIAALTRYPEETQIVEWQTSTPTPTPTDAVTPVAQVTPTGQRPSNLEPAPTTPPPEFTLPDSPEDDPGFKE
jgi:hypothetical protein